MRNTPPRSPIEEREIPELVEDLCIALRNVGGTTTASRTMNAASPTFEKFSTCSRVEGRAGSIQANGSRMSRDGRRAGDAL